MRSPLPLFASQFDRCLMGVKGNSFRLVISALPKTTGDISRSALLAGGPVNDITGVGKSMAANPYKRSFDMSPKSVLYCVRVGIVSGVFAAGYLCGSLSGQSAHAQLGNIGGEMMQKATGSGGMLGSAAQLGTAITDMEKHVSGLQKNLDTLRKVKAALGGK